jgi:hypothetical protein
VVRGVGDVTEGVGKGVVRGGRDVKRVVH